MREGGKQDTEVLAMCSWPQRKQLEMLECECRCLMSHDSLHVAGTQLLMTVTLTSVPPGPSTILIGCHPVQSFPGKLCWRNVHHEELFCSVMFFFFLRHLCQQYKVRVRLQSVWEGKGTGGHSCKIRSMLRKSKANINPLPWGLHIPLFILLIILRFCLSTCP